MTVVLEACRLNWSSIHYTYRRSIGAMPDHMGTVYILPILAIQTLDSLVRV